MKHKFKIENNKTYLPPLDFSNSTVSVKEVWRWGSNNMAPNALAMWAKSSTIHRRILNDKTDYITGQGFTCDMANDTLKNIISTSNNQGESLRSIIHKVVFDKCTFGNAFIEIVTDKNRTFINLFHQDATRCRVSKSSSHIILHHNWSNFNKRDSISLPLYPIFELQSDKTYRSIIHYKDYEPMYQHYGIPKYIAALNAIIIAYKTDKWNLSRLDNSFQPSGVMILDGSVDTPDQADEIAEVAAKKFAGQPGQVMFMVKNGMEGDSTKFVPINSSNDSDWRELRNQSTSDIIIAHSWFRTLSGIEYSTGFSADRIEYEYQIALNSVISIEQQEILEPLVGVISSIVGVDCSSLAFINTPPFTIKPSYMKVWEARLADGLDYDAQDPQQQQYLSTI